MKRKMIALGIVVLSMAAHAQDPVPQTMVDAVSADSLMAYVRVLERASGTYSRMAFTPGNDSSVMYILRSLARHPDVSSAGLDTFVVPAAKAPYGTRPLYNVFAVIRGRTEPQRAVVVGAHLDSYARTPAGNDMLWRTVRAPGADDNATGVATVMELARLFGKGASFGFVPDRTLIFAAFNAEESMAHLNALYLYGSAHFAARVNREGYAVEAMINIDMTGFNTRLAADIVTDDASRFIGERAVAMNAAYALGIALNAPPFVYATYSDHSSFWSAGVPAILLIEHAPPNQNGPAYAANTVYHTPADTSGALNPVLMRKTAQLALATAASFAVARASTSVARKTGLRPSATMLGQNFPNPFNPSTRIPFSVAAEGRVRIAVYDVLGRELAVLVDAPMQPGSYTVDWDARTVRSGCYFCRLTHGASMEATKIVINK